MGRYIPTWYMIYEFWKILFVQKVSSPEIKAKVEEVESISKTKKIRHFNSVDFVDNNILLSPDCSILTMTRYSAHPRGV